MSKNADLQLANCIKAQASFSLFLGAETNTTTSQKAFLNEENCHFFGQLKLDPLLPEMSKEVFGFNLMGKPFLTALLLLLR